MKLVGLYLVVLVAVAQAQIIDPTAPATPCVPSRTVDAAIQTEIALGCEDIVDITDAVCTDYLAQEITTAINYFCGNQTEAFAYCQTLPGTSIVECQGFDPTGGGVYPNCTQAALDQYNICGNSTGEGLFGAGDPVSLAQCLYYDLSLCTPEDGEGHFNTVFPGMQTDCPIPAYTPACGVYSTSGSAAATTTASPSSSSTAPSSQTTEPGPPASPSSSSAAPSFQTTEPGPPASPSSSSAAPSFPTTEPGPPLSTTAAAPSFPAVTTLTPISAPTAPPNPPAGASPYLHLIINGNFAEFVSIDGGVTADPLLAQIFYVLNGQLFTIDGLLVQADFGASAIEPEPYVLFVGSEGTLPFSATFSLVTAGIAPGTKKRQIVGQTTLYWINAAFRAPGTTADFCVSEDQVYAVLLAGGIGANFYAGCVPVSLDAIYIEIPGPASSSSTSAVTPATTSTTSVAFSASSCPIGQTLVAYTTVYF